MKQKKTSMLRGEIRILRDCFEEATLGAHLRRGYQSFCIFIGAGLEPLLSFLMAVFIMDSRDILVPIGFNLIDFRGDYQILRLKHLAFTATTKNCKRLSLNNKK